MLFDTAMPQALASFQGIPGEVYEIGARSLATFVRKDE
jgi:hypothetical protein